MTRPARPRKWPVQLTWRYACRRSGIVAVVGRGHAAGLEVSKPGLDC